MPRWPRPSRSSRARAALGAFLSLAAAAGAAPAQPPGDAPPDRPATARRIVHLFDFEEKDPDDAGDFNPDPVPRFWFRAQDDPAGGRLRPGFPPWNAAEFDLGVAASGSASVRLDAAGGSASLRLMPGAIPVFPGADYVVLASVRTEGVDRSRAFITARLLDAARRPIPASETRSPPLRTGGGWEPVTLDLRGDHPEAAFLQLDLELLQPRQFESGPAQRLGPHAVQLDDISARAWFDDVAIFQVPRVTLLSDAPANITLAPDRPSIRFAVRDMVNAPLDAVLTVADADRQVVSRHALSIDPGGRVMTWTPDLPGLGWYTLTLDVTHAGKPVAVATTQFAWMPELRGQRALDSRGERRRFGLAADDAPPGTPAWPDFAPHVVRAARTGFIILPHADPAVTPGELGRSLALDDTPLDALLELDQEITLSFAVVPDALADTLKIDARDTLALGRHGESVWMPFLLPILDHYGQRILRWQISPSGAAAYAAGHPDLAAALANFHAGLARLVPGPMLAVPWRGDTPPPTLVIPASTPATSTTPPLPPPSTPSPSSTRTTPPSPASPPPSPSGRPASRPQRPRKSPSSSRPRPRAPSTAAPWTSS